MGNPADAHEEQLAAAELEAAELEDDQLDDIAGGLISIHPAVTYMSPVDSDAVNAIPIFSTRLGLEPSIPGTAGSGSSGSGALNSGAPGSKLPGVGGTIRKNLA